MRVARTLVSPRTGYAVLLLPSVRRMADELPESGPLMGAEDVDEPVERAAVLEAFAAWRAPGDARAIERPRFTGYPFTLGVASGWPSRSGVVLWTRLAPDPLHGGGMGAEA